MKKTYTISQQMADPSTYDVESPDGIGSLNPAWPTGAEPVSQGDDHLRNIKLALQQSFPGFYEPQVGDGVPLYENPTNMNYLFGTISADAAGDIEVDGSIEADGEITATGAGDVQMGLTVGESWSGDIADPSYDIQCYGDIVAFYNPAVTTFTGEKTPYQVAKEKGITLHEVLDLMAYEIESQEARIKTLEAGLHYLTQVVANGSA